MIKTILISAGAICTVLAAAQLADRTASADPIPAACFQSSVLDSAECANYSYTGDARYANYGFRCGHDIDANEQQCHDRFRLVPANK